jgi:hypothetical protein
MFSSSFAVLSYLQSFTAITSLRVLTEKFPELGEAVLDTPISQLAPQYNLTLIDRSVEDKTKLFNVTP